MIYTTYVQYTNQYNFFPAWDNEVGILPLSFVELERLPGAPHRGQVPRLLLRCSQRLPRAITASSGRPTWCTFGDRYMERTRNNNNNNNNNNDNNNSNNSNNNNNNNVVENCRLKPFEGNWMDLDSSICPSVNIKNYVWIQVCKVRLFGLMERWGPPSWS